MITTIPTNGWGRALGTRTDIAAILVDLARLSGRPDNAGRFLTETEQQQYERLVNNKRRLEWLGGRIAAKAAAWLVLRQKTADALFRAGRSQAWRSLAIRADIHGRPLVQGPENTRPRPEISISHSSGLAVAMAARQPCGIDIQAIIPTVARIRSRFAGESEEALLAESSGLREAGEHLRLTMLWSAKEALRKMATTPPLPGFLDMELRDIESRDDEKGLFLLRFLWPGKPTGKKRAAVDVVARPRQNHVLAAVSGPLPT